MNIKKLQSVLFFVLLFSFSTVEAQYSISGGIRCANNSPMSNVAVTISGDGINQTVYTDGLGQYEFTNIGMGTYNITPSKEGNNAIEGVTTLDILLALQSIFNNTPINPFAFLAADMNNSGAITTVDLLQIRFILLAIETDCPNDQCWRFASADYQIAPPNGSVDMITVFNLEEGVANIDFVGVKLGDVNFDACP